MCKLGLSCHSCNVKVITWGTQIGEGVRSLKMVTTALMNINFVHTSHLNWKFLKSLLQGGKFTGCNYVNIVKPTFGYLPLIATNPSTKFGIDTVPY